jgi:hypothetical protein
MEGESKLSSKQLINIPNIEYELDLYSFQNSLKNKKISSIVKSFECIYFFSGSSTDIAVGLLNTYPIDYLDYCKNLGCSIPSVILNRETDRNEIDDYHKAYWWGSYDDIEFKRKINSKMWVNDHFKSLELNPSSPKSVNSSTEILSYMDDIPSDKYIFRKDELVGGSGNYLFSNSDKDKIRNKKLGQGVIAPYFNRILDISFIVSPGKNLFSITHNTYLGIIKGGMIFKNEVDFKSYLMKEYKIDDEKLKVTSLNIAENLKSLGVTGDFQVDSFFYEGNNQILYYPVVEVNYRKTMGLFSHYLSSFLMSDQKGRWIVEKKENLKCPLKIAGWKDLLLNLYYFKDTNVGIIPISLPDNNYQIFIFIHNSFRELNDLVTQFQSLNQ